MQAWSYRLRLFFQLHLAGSSWFCFEHYLDKNDEQPAADREPDRSRHAPTVDKQIKEAVQARSGKGFALAWCPWYGAQWQRHSGEEINKMLGVPDSYIKENNIKLLGELLPVPGDVDFDTATSDFPV
jgi:trigger factor